MSNLLLLTKGHRNGSLFRTYSHSFNSFRSWSGIVGVCYATNRSGNECSRSLDFPDYFNCFKAVYAKTHSRLPEYPYLMGAGAVLSEDVRAKKITNAKAYGLWDMKRGEANISIENRAATERSSSMFCYRALNTVYCD